MDKQEAEFLTKIGIVISQEIAILESLHQIIMNFIMEKGEKNDPG